MKLHLHNRHLMFALAACAQASAACAATLTIDSPEAAPGLIARARPGDVVVLPNGVYEDLRIDFKANGAPGDPIVLRAETPGGVTITGEANITISGQHLIVEGLVFDQVWGMHMLTFDGAQHCRLTECAFIECGNPNSQYGHIVTIINGSKSNRVDRCYMQGNLTTAIVVRVNEADHENTDNTFDRNHFREVPRRWPNGGEIFMIGYGGFGTELAMRAVVEHCLFDNTNGDVEVISNKSSHNTYRYNTFRNCEAAELVLRGGAHATVEGNFFFDGLGGVRVHGSHHRIVNNYFEGLLEGVRMRHGSESYQPVHHCLVAHNTIVNCRRRGVWLGATKEGTDLRHANALPPYENTFLNNIVVGDSGVLIDRGSGHGNTWRGNIVWASGDATYGLEGPGLSRADPGLIRDGAIWRLPVVHSPAADSAVPTPEPITEDIDGQPRGGSGLDIGCDELSSLPILRRPLGPRDVGPSWMRGDPTRIRRIESPKPIPGPREAA